MSRTTVNHLCAGVMLGALVIPLLNGLHFGLTVLAILMEAYP